MPPDNPNPTSGANGANGAVVSQEPAAPRPSLREIAEAAYDDLVDADQGDPSAPPSEAEPASGQPAQPRDTLGRYAPKKDGSEPGVAAADKATQPREQQTKDGQTAEPHPAAPPSQETGVRSSEAPANWSAADREMFAKVPQEARDFLLRRHSEMEGDYQRRVQATRGATDFAQALTPVFQDPVIAGSLQRAQASPYHAIVQWAGFHKRAMSGNPADRVGLLQELATRMQVDPAAIATSRPGNAGPAPQLSDEDLKDPAIRFFADHIGRQTSEVQQLRAALQTMQNDAQGRQQAEQVRQARWSIDAFADEKGADGKPLHPDFDAVLPQIMELFRVNPQRDMREAYETARWMHPEIRARLVAAERQTVTQQQDNARAAQAVRSNVRGLTSPVSKPADPGGKKGLRATIEQSAEQVGI